MNTNYWNVSISNISIVVNVNSYDKTSYTIWKQFTESAGLAKNSVLVTMFCNYPYTLPLLRHVVNVNKNLENAFT